MWEALLAAIPMIAQSATHHYSEEQRKNSEAIEVEAYYIDDRLALPAPTEEK